MQLVAEKKIELIGQDKVRIGGKTLNVYYRDPPLSEGITYDVEATADDKHHYDQKLKPHELQGIRIGDFPEGFSLDIFRIDRLDLDYQRFGSVTYWNRGSKYEMMIDYSISFVDWEHPANLRHFADDFVKRLEALHPAALRAKISESEVGVNIFCYRKLQANDDYFKSFLRLIEDVRTVYRRSVQAIPQGLASTKRAEQDKSTEKPRWRWWAQVVIIPIIIALIGLLAVFLSD